MSAHSARVHSAQITCNMDSILVYYLSCTYIYILHFVQTFYIPFYGACFFFFVWLFAARSIQSTNPLGLLCVCVCYRNLICTRHTLMANTACISASINVYSKHLRCARCIRETYNTFDGMASINKHIWARASEEIPNYHLVTLCVICSSKN